ncbi:hypothetical protein HG535_0B06560 [Zygotorulaspora mrakii]|uniref:Uncharacterized protein n=1 Tax=Zygotorulaspora mrakii TaxID=42260 RepID=A0A7H9AZ52_ZYGMR|nr:uncharacterized protein HG535_0B06560 [Zygotorulaspora mrakii]QLG71611.1 hypothetical protein HG535_0B06560 [Zygotorulaspora mrakii]
MGRPVHHEMSCIRSGSFAPCTVICHRAQRTKVRRPGALAANSSGAGRPYSCAVSPVCRECLQPVPVPVLCCAVLWAALAFPVVYFLPPHSAAALCGGLALASSNGALACLKLARILRETRAERRDSSRGALKKAIQKTEKIKKNRSLVYRRKVFKEQRLI